MYVLIGVLKYKALNISDISFICVASSIHNMESIHQLKGLKC